MEVQENININVRAGSLTGSGKLVLMEASNSRGYGVEVVQEELQYVLRRAF